MDTVIAAMVANQTKLGIAFMAGLFAFGMIHQHSGLMLIAIAMAGVSYIAQAFLTYGADGHATQQKIGEALALLVAAVGVGSWLWAVLSFGGG